MKKDHAIYGLILLLVAVSEYLIFLLTTQYGANVDVVSHVGFAGTILSIILALLAIIYSYYQSFAQKRDSDFLASQLQQLSGLSSRLDAAVKGFENQSTQMQAVERHMQEGVRTTQRLESFLSSWKEAASSDEGQSAPPAVNEAPHGPAEMIAQLLRGAGPMQMAIYALIHVSVQKSWSVRQASDELRKLVAKRLKSEKPPLPGDSIERLSQWVDGIFTGVVWLLGDFGLLEAEDRDPANNSKTEVLHIVSVNEEITRAVMHWSEEDGYRDPKPLLLVADVLALLNE